MGDSESAGLLECGTEKLNAEGEVFFGFSDRDGDSADSGEGGGDGEDVFEVHLEGVGGVFADVEGGSGGDGSEDGVDFLECVVKISADERADFLRFSIKCVVVAGGECVGSEEDSSFDFVAEVGFSGLSVNFFEVFCVGSGFAEADSVESGHVRRNFRSDREVVTRNCVFCVREGDFDNFGAEGSTNFFRGFDHFENFGVDAVEKILGRDSDSESVDVFFDFSGVVWNLDSRCGGISRVASGDGLQEKRAVGSGASEWSNRVETRCHRNCTPAGNSSVRNFESGATAEICRLADGSTGVCANRTGAKISGDRRCRPSGTASGDFLEVVGVFRDAECGVFRRSAHRELVGVGFSEEDGTGGF